MKNCLRCNASNREDAKFCSICGQPSTLIYKGHLGKKVNSVSWSPSGTEIASASDDATVQIWEAATGRLIFTHMGHMSQDHTHHHEFVRVVSWSPNGRYIVSGGSNNNFQIWDPNTGKILAALACYTLSASWAPDGETVALATSSSSRDHNHMVDAVGLCYVKKAKYKEGYLSMCGEGYQSHGGGITSTAWSPKSPQERILASGDNRGEIHLWNCVYSFKHLYVYRGHRTEINSLAWSPNGASIASGSKDGEVQVWTGATGSHTPRRETGRHIVTYTDHTGGVSSVGWSPNGTQIASGSHDKTVRVWNAVTESCMFVYNGHSDKVNSIAWSPSGTRIASASDDGTVQIWQAI